MAKKSIPPKLKCALYADNQKTVAAEVIAFLVYRNDQPEAKGAFV